ncbi:hypothetical protein [Natrinema amylolyticum]|uniref:hypothetical protein n=1 Tax=Natrinema amylolyticum TaxID=2878679 RepID=UPI001CFADD3B|nr:hypothetical protein [Natrinema amylolyticum]
MVSAKKAGIAFWFKAFGISLVFSFLIGPLISSGNFVLVYLTSAVAGLSIVIILFRDIEKFTKKLISESRAKEPSRKTDSNWKGGTNSGNTSEDGWYKDGSQEDAKETYEEATSGNKS